MHKGELQKLLALAKKNAEKAAREVSAEEAKRNPKKGEKKSVDEAMEASEAHKLFAEMKVREF